MVASNERLFELQTVLMREKFRRYLTGDEALEYILWLREGATLAEDERTRATSRYPDDDYLLDLAANSRTDYLVSGDGDLLDLEETMVKIVSPRDFHDILEAANEER